MSKYPLTKEILEKTVQTTQAIEGYKRAEGKTAQKAQETKEKYGIKVSPRK